MNQNFVIPLADEQASLAVAGGKGSSLARLARAGLPVPDGFHITTAAYRQFISANELQPAIMAALNQVDTAVPTTLERASHTISRLICDAEISQTIANEIAGAYERLPGSLPAVAVRSSATAEDLPDLSFAGQQETFLNIWGVAAVLEAVKRCWASLWTARAIGYRAQHAIDSEMLSLAVVVQLMVQAEAAGILFTANPVNGRRDQILINAAWGLGEAIVGGEVTPDAITIDKNSGQVVARETAVKHTMTTNSTHGTITQSVPEHLQQAPVLDDQTATDLAQLGLQIETLTGCPMDIEWTLAEGALNIVQARPITALPEPEAPIPTDWPMPDPEGKYMRTSIIDLMPNPLSPLFGTLGLNAINAGLLRLISEYFVKGKEPVFPADTMVRINDYAYMGVNFTKREWWWMLTRMVPVFYRVARKGKDDWKERARPKYAAVVAHWQAQPITTKTSAELLTGVNEMMEAVMDHLGALMVGTMGVSAGSEGLFTNIYQKLAQREGDPPAATFLMGYNSIPIQAEKSLYDLAQWCTQQPDLAAYLLKTAGAKLTDQFQNDQMPAGVDPVVWQEWRRRFDAHLRQFGHIVYDLDFASPLPIDDPAPMLETCKMYLRGQGSNPHERQQKLTTEREQATAMMLQRLRGPRRWIFQKSLGWAQSQAEVREDGIADFGLGYPVLRQMLRELGRRCALAGAIAEPDDIFWLEQAELETAVSNLEQG